MISSGVLLSMTGLAALRREISRRRRRFSTAVNLGPSGTDKPASRATASIASRTIVATCLPFALATRCAKRSVSGSTGNVGVTLMRGFSISRRRVPTIGQRRNSLRESSNLQLWVEPIAQRVAEQVEAEHGERDGNARVDRHPWRALGIFLGTTAQHQAPRGYRLLHA